MLAPLLFHDYDINWLHQSWSKYLKYLLFYLVSILSSGWGVSMGPWQRMEERPSLDNITLAIIHYMKL